MLISHSWHTFNFESAYKEPCFIMVAIFFGFNFSNQICKAKEVIKLLPYYLYDDKYFIYKTVKTSHLKKLQTV